MSQFEDLISFIRKDINRCIKRLPIPDSPAYLYDPIKYALKGRGKRFRPILAHLVGRANKIDPDSLMNVSLAIELLHNFTLIHDDIMDKDTIRHGQKTIHNKWDISTAILAGDGIYTIAQLILNNLNNENRQVIKCFNEVTLDICEGQALDKEFEGSQDITEDLYLEMVKKKTSSLISASAMLPSIINKDSKEITELYSLFGEYLGKGFQIHDDLLEITSDVKTMGKSLGSDIYEGKQTLLVIKAKINYKKNWNNIISELDQSDLKNNIYKFVNDKGILKDIKLTAESYFNKSRMVLKKLKHINTDELFQFIELVEKRTY
ncbi:MAG: hypothetical protein CMG55_03265 [Candidatus Marinimicrobia bacterium]|nr:hypothetical protein [Candidatus Neomarinimicrobiota bacterium]|tara:strand:+ start:297 stop:1256 length:960 start_codon:yes stop_codon:yes gene_type:complete